MDQATQRLMQGAAGAGGDKVYVEDVFSIKPYRGDGQNGRAVVNNLDYTDGKGLVWIKHRGSSVRSRIHNTVRGANKSLSSSHLSAEASDYDYGTLSSFNNNGFTLTAGGSNINYVNQNGEKFISWGFKAAEKFMDIQVYDGTGSEQRINHDLGVIPYMVMIKRLEAEDSWVVWHNRLSSQTAGYLNLNTNNNEGSSSTYWSSDGSAPNDQVGNWKIGTHNHVNASGEKYLMVLFAHNEAVFGDGGDKPLCHVYSYTGDGSSNNHINIGFEPQFTMIKRRDSSAHWYMHDSMRGVFSGEDDWRLQADQDDLDGQSGNYIKYTPTGFTLESAAGGVNASGGTYVYIAIRRPDFGVGKPAELGTDVFTMDYGSASNTIPTFDSGFPVDFGITKNPTSSEKFWCATRPTDDNYFRTDNTDAESSLSYFEFDSTVGWGRSTSSNYLSWMWKRHAGFDIVTPNIPSSPTYQTYDHGLGRVPEMIWAKNRDSTGDLQVYHKDLNGGTNPYNYKMNLNTGNQTMIEDTFIWGFNELPTATQFKIKSGSFGTGQNIFLLFASVEGICKVGGYSGSASAQTITTGFQPRMVIIRNYTDEQDWVLLDTVRGWTSGSNDPRLELNRAIAQITNTNFGYPTSTGFYLEGDKAKTNKASKNFIYYAHA